MTIVLILAGTIRIYLAATMELWFDEAFTGLAVAGDWQYLWHTISQDGLHPPLAYILQKISVEIFGNYPFTLRIPSLIAGITLIPLTYWLSAAATKSKRKALLAATFVAASPFMILYSVEARSYMLLALFSTLWAFAIFFHVHQQKRNYLLLVVLSILLALTHLFALLWVAAGWLYVLFYLINQDNSRFTAVWNALRSYWTVILPIGFLFLLVLQTVGALMVNTVRHNFFWLPQNLTIQSVLDLLYSYTFGIDTKIMGFSTFFTSSLGINTTIVILAILVSLIIAWRKQHTHRLSYLLIVLTFLPLFLGYLAGDALGVNLFLPRYFVLSAPLLLILLSIELAKLKNFNLLMLLTCIAVFTLTLNFSIAPYNFDSKVAQITAQHQSYDYIVVPRAIDFVVLKYYLVNHPTILDKLITTEDISDGNWAHIKSEENLTPAQIANSEVLIVE